MGIAGAADLELQHVLVAHNFFGAGVPHVAAAAMHLQHLVGGVAQPMVGADACGTQAAQVDGVKGDGKGRQCQLSLLAGHVDFGQQLLHGRVLAGPNGLAGLWGHNPLPWREASDPWPDCYCGQSGCIETLVSGPGLAAEHHARTGRRLSAEQIALAAAQGNASCVDTIGRWQHRLARALAQVINLLDPDVIVLGGGLSRVESTYRELPALWDRWVFSGGLKDPVRTALRPSLHGDSSGVRGAAWLWRGPAPR